MRNYSISADVDRNADGYIDMTDMAAYSDSLADDLYESFSEKQQSMMSKGRIEKMFEREGTKVIKASDKNHDRKISADECVLLIANCVSFRWC